MRRAIVGLAVAVQAVLCASTAMALTSTRSAYWPPKSDPSSNFAVPAHGLPFACLGSPTSATCIKAAVYYLDKGRARLSQPAYKLPADFAHLTPAEQAFILTNLDRAYYSLPPISGLTHALNQDSFKSQIGGAVYGIYTDSDPESTDANFPYWAANWAGAFPNMVLAYQAWVYDDGYGSNNIDCTSPGSSGCWGHRHDVLYEVPATGHTAMGAAVGKDLHGATGYAMLLGAGDSNYQPNYYYTWAQAASDGAGSNTYTVSRPAAAQLNVSINPIGSSLIVNIKPPAGRTSVGSDLRCSLVRKGTGGFPANSFKSCGKSVTYPNIGAGTYLLDVTSSIGWASEGFTLTSAARDLATTSSTHHERLVVK
jgi:hypothetical protein